MTNYQVSQVGRSAAQVDAAIAAAVVGRPPVVPAWVTGRYYDGSSLYPSATFVDVTGLANTIFYAPFWVPYDVTVDRLAIYVSVASGTGGATARLALYNKHATLWKPGAVLLDAGTVAIDSTGLKTITISQALVGGNWYWTAFNGSATGASIKGFQNGVALGGRSDLSLPPEWCFQEVLAFGVMPANATPTAGGANLRTVSVRAA